MHDASPNFDLELLKQGTAEQRATVINQFRDYLRNLAREEVKGKPHNQLSASDFVQRTIIQADQSMDQCRATDVQQFKAWLRQIMIHEILNRRKFLKRAKRDIRREEPLISSIAVSQTSPSENLVAEEEKSALLHAIQCLSPEHQTVVLARHRDNLTFVEISKRMDRSPDAVRMLWNRAVKQLSATLKSRQETDGDEQH